MPMYWARCINGYNETRQRVFVHRRLHYMPYGQCGIYMNPRYWILISYATEMAYLYPNHVLMINGLYSATSRRHLSAFLREYCPSITYQMAKKAYENGCVIDIKTGVMFDPKTHKLKV